MTLKGKWSSAWTKLFIWVSAYVNFLVLAIVGGFVIVKSNDDELKKTSKYAFITYVAFLVLELLVSVVYNFVTMGSNLSSGFYKFDSIIRKLLSVSKICVFVAFATVDFIKGIKLDKSIKPIEVDATVNEDK